MVSISKEVLVETWDCVGLLVSQWVSDWEYILSRLLPNPSRCECTAYISQMTSEQNMDCGSDDLFQGISKELQNSWFQCSFQTSLRWGSGRSSLKIWCHQQSFWLLDCPAEFLSAPQTLGSWPAIDSWSDLQSPRTAIRFACVNNVTLVLSAFITSKTEAAEYL